MWCPTVVDSCIASSLWLRCSYNREHLCFMLDGHPQLKELRGIMNSEGDVITKWYDIGLELLDSDNGVLDVIKINYPNDNEKCCIEMFKKWQQCRPDASWHQLAEALTNVNLNTAAHRITESGEYDTRFVYGVFSCQE